jgi:NADPH:quinone reductase-like Zn-dependent oxidoreductase
MLSVRFKEQSVALPQSMRAWRIHRYGGPAELVLDDAPVPTPLPGELLVRVAAASVNPIDYRMRQGAAQKLFPVEFPRTLGRDCAGMVAESRSERFTPGDRVLGVNDQKRTGTHAEYAIVPDSQAIKLPPPVGDVQAVAIGNSGATAWSALVGTAQVATGQRILIHAGSGGVGGISVQLARHAGCEVIATCSTRNVEYVRTLGAHRVIDYTREKFWDMVRDCDVVFDMVGGETHRRSFDCLKPGGLLIWVTAWGHETRPASRNDVRVLHVAARATSDRLQSLIDLVAEGALKPQIGRIWRFVETPEAYAVSESGRSRGKNIIVMNQE